MISTIHGAFYVRGIEYHADSAAFFAACAAAGSSLGPMEKAVTDRLVRDLHGEFNPSYSTSNVWSKYLALYPFVGAASGSHSINLKNPGAFRLSFIGSPTHSANGVEFNGSSQYANTHLNQTLLSYSNNSISIYTDNFSGGVTYIYGTYDGGVGIVGWAKNSGVYINMGTFGSYSIPIIGGGGGSVSITKFTTVDFSSSSRVDLYCNGVSFYDTTPSPSANSAEIFIAALSQGGTPIVLSGMYCKFFGVANNSLTSTENLHLNNAVAAYQTALSRA